ncbi:hypothetical protein EQG49_12600 [Periweissella cryptocerci]|uniref:Uncharacterized protein n=1 Tax=Periweissella cryptocerci TaxID=2506420 RepID=A0A4P6YWT2_9LACO|nr:hypothetical protein [Periweissella cryptocerci]QBO37237.1 hypothetical protein EQG49_12600 [Periweissella cryptocerci]
MKLYPETGQVFTENADGFFIDSTKINNVTEVEYERAEMGAGVYVTLKIKVKELRFTDQHINGRMLMDENENVHLI